MSDLSFLEYIANPYALIAVVAVVLGFGFRTVINKSKNPKPGFVIAMYSMFVLAVLGLVLGGLAILFILSGDGAEDSLARIREANFSFIETVKAEPGGDDFSAEKFLTRTDPVLGWIWIGKSDDIPAFSNKPQQLRLEQSPQSFSRVETVSDLFDLPEPSYLRDQVPYFSWWRFRYVLGEKISVLPAGTRVQVLEKKYVGRNWWFRVKVFPVKEKRE